MRTRILLRSGLAAALAALLLSTVQSSHAEDEPEYYEGLPELSFGSWANGSQGGFSYATRAKQWFRTSIGMSTVENSRMSDPADPDNPLNQMLRIEAYFVSPKGAPANYGYLEPMTVRSVGFGLMPVEATVQVSQRRENGYPVPFKLAIGIKSEVIDVATNNVNEHYHPAHISESVDVRILSVRVDGVDLGLNGDCRTVDPAPISMRSPAYTIENSQRYPGYVAEWFRSHDPSEFFDVQFGGELRGSLTIPPFTGCTTSAGDDLSDLMTLSVSGADNPVIARAGWGCPFLLEGRNAPVPPGVSNPRLGGGHAPVRGYDPRYCPGVTPFEYPERTDR